MKTHSHILNIMFCKYLYVGNKNSIIAAYPDEFLPCPFIIRWHPDCHIHTNTRDSMDPHTSCLLGRRCSLQDHKIFAGKNYNILFIFKDVFWRCSVPTSAPSSSAWPPWTVIRLFVNLLRPSVGSQKTQM